MIIHTPLSITQALQPPSDHSVESTPAGYQGAQEGVPCRPGGELTPRAYKSETEMCHKICISTPCMGFLYHESVFPI